MFFSAVIHFQIVSPLCILLIEYEVKAGTYSDQKPEDSERVEVLKLSGFLHFTGFFISQFVFDTRAGRINQGKSDLSKFGLQRQSAALNMNIMTIQATTHSVLTERHHSCLIMATMFSLQSSVMIKLVKPLII